MNKFQEIRSKLDEAFRQHERLANYDPQKTKAIALANSIVAMAEDMVELSTMLSRPKRIFQKKDRRPKNKIDRRKKIWAKIIKLRMHEMQNQLIMSTPIPKYPHGYKEHVGGMIIKLAPPESLMDDK